LCLTLTKTALWLQLAETGKLWGEFANDEFLEEILNGVLDSADAGIPEGQRRTTALSSALLTGPESHREGLVQVQAVPALGQDTYCRTLDQAIPEALLLISPVSGFIKCDEGPRTTCQKHLESCRQPIPYA
jgi:hypothetical protein